MVLKRAAKRNISVVKLHQPLPQPKPSPITVVNLEQKQAAEVPEWLRLMRTSINSAVQLEQKFGIDRELALKILEKYAVRINSYYMSLIREKGDPIWKQVVPDEQEIATDTGYVDSLAEDAMMPVPGLTHRYPDRVLFLVTNQCAMYCRFCTRKRVVGVPERTIPKSQIVAGIEYIRQHPEVRDVIISGGDPLLLLDQNLEFVLRELRAIPHLDIIRIDTRMPCFLPQRVTPELCSMLKKYHPLYVLVHFNHPREITPESSLALNRLADAGIPLGSQTVLLKGVNDNPQVMKELMQKLLKNRVRPYYIYQADLERGTEHFRTGVEKGLEIIKALRGWTSGLAVPHFVIDAPGGGGKVPLLPEYILSMDDKEIVMRNYRGKLYRYPLPRQGQPGQPGLHNGQALPAAGEEPDEPTALY